MAVGVSMANAILLVSFSEQQRRATGDSVLAAIGGGGSRLRAILMTSLAMVAGMLPMALAYGEAGQQNAPLGRAVVGGLIASLAATLFILPLAFVLLMKNAHRKSASLDPEDPESRYFAN